MKKNFQCTLSHSEDREGKCAGSNFWATLSTTHIFKGILGRSPETGEDGRCYKKLMMHRDDYTGSQLHPFFYFHILTDGCLGLCKVGRKDTAILVLQMMMWDQRVVQWLASGHMATGGWHEDWTPGLSRCLPRDSMWPQWYSLPPCWQDRQLPASGLNWVWVQTMLYKCAVRNICETDI